MPDILATPSSRENFVRALQGEYLTFVAGQQSNFPSPEGQRHAFHDALSRLVLELPEVTQTAAEDHFTARDAANNAFFRPVLAALARAEKGHVTARGGAMVATDLVTHDIGTERLMEDLARLMNRKATPSTTLSRVGQVVGGFLRQATEYAVEAGGALVEATLGAADPRNWLDKTAAEKAHKPNEYTR